MALVAGIGGANVDLHGRAGGPITLRDSNPGRLHLSPGGVARNILENLARLGADAALVSAVGQDAYGALLHQSCEAAGLNAGRLRAFPGRRSSCYVSLLDEAGDMLVAMSDMEILREEGPGLVRENLPFLNSASYVVCDGNLPPEAMELLTEGCRRPLLFDPVSTAWAKLLAPYAGRLDTLKPNRLELAALTGCDCSTGQGIEDGCDALLRRGARRVFVSLGADGMYYKGRDGQKLHQAARPFVPLVNATGAGDAAMAGIVWATLQGLGALATVRWGMGAALCALSSPDTVDPAICPQKVEGMIKEYLL